MIIRRPALAAPKSPYHSGKILPISYIDRAFHHAPLNDLKPKCKVMRLDKEKRALLRARGAAAP